MNRNWTGKLQVALLFALFPERNDADTFSKPLRKKQLWYILKNLGKIHERGCVNGPARFPGIVGNTRNHGNDGKFHESH